MPGLFAVLVIFPFLPGASSSPASRQGSAAPHSLDLSSAVLWRPEAGWLSNPSAEHAVIPGEGLRFTAAPPGRGMKWRYVPAQPISTAGRPVATVRYRARGIDRTRDYFIHLIGQPIGKSVREFTAIPLSSIIDDELWHQLSVEVPPMQVAALAVQVQAAAADAYVEIASIRFAPERTTTSLHDRLTIREGWLQAERYRPIGFDPNTRARPWLDSLGIEPNPFEQRRVTVENIPFQLPAPDPQVLATSLENRDEVAVDLGCAPESLYLLMGARFTGQESPSIGAGPLVQVRQVERFVVRLEYADGTNDLVFPARFPCGQHVIVQEPGVYVVQPTRPGIIKRLSLVDGMRQGQFLLMALTVGPKPQERASEPYTSPSPPLARASAPPSDAIATQIATLALSNQQEATALANLLTQSAWLSSPSRLYTIESPGTVEAKLDAKPLSNGEIELTLELVNNTEQPVTVTATFPRLSGLSPGGDPQDLMYCFPRRGCAISASEVDLREPCGGRFPLQFIDVYHPEAGGWYIMVRDTSNTPKTYRLKKKTSIDVGVEYWPTVLQPKQHWTLPAAVLGAHRGDWHDALRAYRQWLAGWYRPAVERKQWFREVFNLRQQFLHLAMPRPSGIFDPKTGRLDLLSVVQADAHAFGGIDYLHLFDWDCTPTRGCRGDYNPWEYLGGLDQFAAQIRQVQETGIPVGLYIEGYLVNPKSNVFQSHAEEWQMLQADGSPYSLFAPQKNMCPHLVAWQDYLTETFSRVARESGANGYYIDQFGNASIYLCHNPNHGHPVPTSPLRDEAALTQKVRQAIPRDSVLYTEDTPTDVTSQYQDGSFTYAIACTIESLAPVALNMTRFALPDFKTFEIIACDAPLNDDRQAVKRIFFNGEGIWLEGIAEDWFTPETRATIGKTHRILRRYRNAFTSLDAVPLIPTRHRDILANRFSAPNETAWTLYNAAYHTVRADVLAIDHVPGATYRDAWNDRPIQPTTRGNQDVISLELGPRDFGCIVQLCP